MSIVSNTSNNNSTKRRISQLLPEVNQTDTISKFLEATADHLFQPQSVEYLSGYIGDQPSYYNPITDFYIGEINQERTNYQLGSTAVSYNTQTGEITNAMFYDDFINQLSFHGANVNNHSRLFEQEYYSWCPPIDLDKFLNYNQYVWLDEGVSLIQLLDPTDADDDIIGQLNYTYTGRYTLTSTGVTIDGTITPLVFTTGLRIQLNNDDHIALNNNPYIVEGVGQGMLLVPDLLGVSYPWDTTPWDMHGWDKTNADSFTDYFTIARGCTDQNTWSQYNRWFHLDVVNLSQTSIPDLSAVIAQRPIIEFERNIQLYNYGTIGRGTVNLVSKDLTDAFNTIVGQSIVTIDGIRLQDGLTILILNDIDPTVNNKIYEVAGLTATGQMQLVLVANGINSDGSPAAGERVLVENGLTYTNQNFWWNGTSWIQGQTRVNSVFPLFDLFDSNGNELADPANYPSSSFTGNAIFSYQITATNPVDTVLNINTTLDQFGQFVYENNLVTDTADITYLENNQSTSYVGYGLYCINSATPAYYNGWYKASSASRQYIVNNFDVTTATNTFTLDQIPAPNVLGELPTCVVNYITKQTETLLVLNVDYILQGATVVLLKIIAQPGDRLNIRSWSNTTPTTLTGYYELPLNLTANPNNDEVTTIGRSDFLSQFQGIIASQNGLTGNALGNNSWRDSLQDRSLGIDILQHKAPMLKTMLLSSGNLVANASSASSGFSTQSVTDPVFAIQFAQREYTRFYSRFVRTLFALPAKQGYNISNSPQQWVAAALAQVNLGKTAQSAWLNSGYDLTEPAGSYCYIQANQPTYIPPTAARLGISEAYQPMVYVDSFTYTEPKLVLQGHDGSRMILEDLSGNQLGVIIDGSISTTSPANLSDPIAKAWLQFELNQFNYMPETYQDADAVLVFDQRTLIPGKWRLSNYSQNEYLSILGPIFDKWTIANQVDFRKNTIDSGNVSQINNQFLLNYSSQTDKQGQPIPGYWQGIYRWFYDTDRPHITPWEMLGFSIMPDWWTTEYGVAPYTSGNTHLWNDLTQGLIRQGARSGIDTNWARPGLLSCIPVDQQGNLLSPYFAGCVASLPSVSAATAPWAFGDGGPIESVWRYSTDWSFAEALSGYLMKPAQFIEYTWDNLRANNIDNQWIYIDTFNRRNSDEFYVHRENPTLVKTAGNAIPNESTLTYYGASGIQHWISEYLVSLNFNVTNYFGNLIRGGDVRLGHRFGGFVATDGLQVLVDSFGQLGYNSQIVPQENIHINLYRSASIGEYTYSGVIIQQVTNGWAVVGYDGTSQQFTIIPSNIYGAKSTVTLGNYSVTEYKVGLKTTYQVPYYTVFTTRQQVYDFLISYGRWLTSQGWIFDQFNSDNNTMYNWAQSGKEFLFWSQTNWADGNFIALSPLATQAKFSQEFGIIQFVSSLISNTYPVLDKTGMPIQSQALEVLRSDGEIIVQPLNSSSQGIFLLRLFATTIEHVVFFDQQTVFNDIIYDPLLNLAQSRLKLTVYRVNDWNGRLDAPGYLVYQNTSTNQWELMPNLDKTADDFRNYFNIDQPTNYTVIDPISGTPTEQNIAVSAITSSDISNLAKHNVGYQQRQYLQNLLLEDATEFEFYQGFIKQKGTISPINALLRNISIVPQAEDFENFEQFALRVGRYGSVSLNANLAFILQQGQVKNDPQWIDLFTGYNASKGLSQVIEIVPRDPNIVVQPENYEGELFALRNYYGVNVQTDLPSAGYVTNGDTTFQVTNSTVLGSLYTNQAAVSDNVQIRDTVWQYILDEGNNSWGVFQVRDTGVQIDYLINSNITGQPTTVVLNAGSVGNVSVFDNQSVIIFGNGNASIPDGTYVVSNVSVNVSTNTTSFQIDQSSFGPGTGGNVWVYSPVRFSNVTDRDNNPPPGGWLQGDYAWVDSGDYVSNAWTVYSYFNNNWLPIRVETPKIDPTLQLQARLYDSTTLQILQNLSYWDPAKGVVPGIAGSELNYVSIYDPANYNQGDSTIYNLQPGRAWGQENLGKTWWNANSARYINYESGSNSYRWKNWGRLAAGTTVDVYEWVRSPIPPTNWSSYVTQGTSFAQYGLSYSPSGTVLNASSPAWTQTTEYDSSGTPTTWYYFWVTGATTIPLPTNRSLYTPTIAAIITNPSAQGIPWYAATSTNSIVVGQVAPYLNGKRTVLDLLYTEKSTPSNDHKQWQLVSEGDPTTSIDSMFYLKLHDSLVGFDGLNNQVPDPNLNTLIRYGTQIRPRQTWFINRVLAAQTYIDTANTLIAGLATPLTVDPNLATWVNYFNAADPEPTQSEGGWSYHVADLSAMNALIGTITDQQIVLVDPTVATYNIWTMWQWNATYKTFNLYRQQLYNTPNYWEYVDWYANGYSSSTTVNYTVSTLTERNSIDSTVDGIIVNVTNIGNNTWAWYVSSSNTWQLVALESGSIYILPNVYNPELNGQLYDQSAYDTMGYDSNTSYEFSNIINGLTNAVFGTTNSTELNTLFFTMINYVLAEQQNVDWIIKTSMVTFKGLDIPLSASTLYGVDNTDSLLSFIAENKPYRTKIQTFVSSNSVQDNANISTSDFDMPPVNGVILNPDNPADAAILASNSATSMWYANYRTNPQLIRTFNVTILFDRVSSGPTEVFDVISATVANTSVNGSIVEFTVTPAPSSNTFTIGQTIGLTGVNSVPLNMYNNYNVSVLDISGSVITAFYTSELQKVSGSGGVLHTPPTEVAGRIAEYYAPLVTGIPLNDPELISGSSYTGSVLDGGSYNFASAIPYLSTLSTQEQIDNYIELIVQGGAPPNYQTFKGDGVTTNFKLKYAPQAVSLTGVWCNGVLQQYGSNWLIPNSITNANVSVTGSGYTVGDIISLSSDFAAATVQVLSTNNSGGITNVSIITNGHYNVIPIGSITCTGGTGSGAEFIPVWGGTTLVFLTPPPVTVDLPNIYVLYAGETFAPAPSDDSAIIYDGNVFLSSADLQSGHPEELYPARLADSIRIDTYQQAIAGAGIMSTRQYTTDGVNDRFILSVTPENTTSILAWLNGNLLKYGPYNDYVINFEDHTVVFGAPPEPGILQITAFSVGGAGTSVTSAYNVDPGIGYKPYDIITLSGSGNPNPNVIVQTVQVVNVTIISGGSAFNKGDVLVVNEANIYQANDNVVVTVGNVSVYGEILDVALTQPGQYTSTFTYPSYITNGSGVNANIALEWGVHTVEVENAGFYLYKLPQPINQSNTTGSGTGATFNVTFDNVSNTIVTLSDGVSTTYVPGVAANNADQVYVTLNGVPTNNLTVMSGNIILNEVPIIDTEISITVFENSNFSKINQEDIYIVNGQYTYPLTYPPFSTKPGYNSTIVLRNGRILRPPSNNTYIGDGVTNTYNPYYIPFSSSNVIVSFTGNGVTTEFNTNVDIGSSDVLVTVDNARIPGPYISISNSNVTVTPTPAAGSNVLIEIISYEFNSNYFNVFVNNTQLIYNTDYTVESSNITILATPPKGSTITMVATDPNYGYEYSLDLVNNTITFVSIDQAGWDILGWDNDFGWDYAVSAVQPDDTIVVTTFSEDSAWDFKTESFNQNLKGEYVLAGIPLRDTSMIVAAAGVVLRRGIDYTVSYSKSATPTVTINITPTANSTRILVTYATGIASAPPIAWRTLITDNSSTSWALNDSAKTTLLSSILVGASTINVADITKITLPTATVPGAVWIDNELIEFWTYILRPVSGYPNAALLGTLNRSRKVTSSSPDSINSVLYYNGDGATFLYAAASGTPAIGEAIFVNGIIQNSSQVTSVIDPAGVPAGRYYQFNVAPPVGYKNIKISSLVIDNSSTGLVHSVGATVIDASAASQIPGGYQWTPSHFGLQNSNTYLSQFLIARSGTES
jgi:hypothetical protein